MNNNKFPMENSYSARNIATISIALILGVLFTYIFKILIFDLFIATKKYPDFGPSLFLGGQPDKLLYLYVLFVMISTVVGWGLLSKVTLKINKELFWWRRLAFILVIVLTIVAAVGVGAIGRNLSTPHIHVVWLMLMAGIVLASFYFFGVASKSPAYSLYLMFARVVFYLIFTTISLLNLPKLYVLQEIFVQSGMRYPALGFFLGASILAAGIGAYLAQFRPIYERVLVALVLVMIYFISIREAWIYWDLDAFHEGESFLTVQFLTRSNYEFIKDFVPTHGFGRNILHGYFTSIFTDNNLYFSRIIQALTYPFIHVLVAATLIRYTRSLLVPVTFFVLTYLFGLLEERDISPFLLMALLIVPLVDEENKVSPVSRIFTGVLLFLSSIYSIEYFIFLNIAMIFAMGHNLFSRAFSFGKGAISWIYVSYFGCLALFFIFLGPNLMTWFDIMINSLQKSPNLLQRPLGAPLNFSLNYFLISIFFPFFLLFFISQVIAYLRSKSHICTSLNCLISIISMVSIMFFVRAFNRSDYEHVLYAFAISMPVILALAMHQYLISLRAFSFIGLILLGAFIMQGLMMRNLSLDTLRHRPSYDSRIKITDIKPAQEFGAITVPAGKINDAHMTKDELASFKKLVDSGYKLFDMTNQPVLIYGVIGSPLIANDMHTLFYNTYAEQRAVIKRLLVEDKVVVIWSANHWTENLDFTYAEYRLPLLSEYVLNNYKNSYKNGRFTLLTKDSLSSFELINLTNAPAKYQLGYAPSRMAPYKQELVESEIVGDAKKPTRRGRPDALVVTVKSARGGEVVIFLKSGGKIMGEISFKVPSEDSRNFVRLNNLPSYVYSDPPEISVVASDTRTKIKSVESLFLSPALPE